MDIVASRTALRGAGLRVLTDLALVASGIVLSFVLGPFVRLGMCMVLALFILGRGLRLFLSHAPRPKAQADARAVAIDALYRKLRQLEADPTSPSAEIDSTFARLRSLQHEEVAEMRERSETSLARSSADALSAIREARRVLGRDEDPAPSHAAAAHQV